MPVLDIFRNDILWKVILISFLTQILKIFIHFFRKKEWNWRLVFETGGMPSSHSATVCGLSTLVGIKEGFSSTIFAVTVIFSLIVMYDSAGVRRAMGYQATVLNKIMEEVEVYGKIRSERLKELLGHSPVEVFVGAFIGIILGVLFSI